MKIPDGKKNRISVLVVNVELIIRPVRDLVSLCWFVMMSFAFHTGS